MLTNVMGVSNIIHIKRKYINLALVFIAFDKYGWSRVGQTRDQPSLCNNKVSHIVYSVFRFLRYLKKSNNYFMFIVQ